MQKNPKHNYIVLFLLITAVSVLSGCLEKETDNEEPKTILIEQPYGFATLPGTTNGAAFMVIKNIGSEDDKLTGLKARFAGISELHENIIDPDDGTMMMRKISDITIPAGGEAVLEPKGKHLMFLKLKEPLTLGQKTPITLEFEKAGDIKVELDIIQPGALPTGHNH